MIYPNKTIPLKDSIIYKMTVILEYNARRKIAVAELFILTKSKFQDIDEFIFALDVLYILKKIEINFETKTISYAEGDSL